MKNKKEKYCSKNLDEILNKISGYKIVKENTRLEEELQDLRDRINTKEFRIAVTGEFSSGKSTFINALIGKDLLSHATVETTAAITKIINVAKNDKRCNTGEVNFHNKETIVLNDFSELSNYTTTKSTMQVVDEISDVNIYVNFFDTDTDFVVVDTPGLNGCADKHRELTNDEIRNSHACIYLFQSTGVKETDVIYLKSLMKTQTIFVFVLNGIDKFNLLEETLESNLKQLEEEVRNKIIGDNRNIETYFCGVSSLKALVGIDKTIKKIYQNDVNEIKEEERDKIYKESNFEKFKQILGELLNSEDLKQKTYISNKSAVLDLISRILFRANWKQDKLREIAELKGENERIEFVQKRLEKLKNEEILKKNKNFLKTKVSNKYIENSKKIDRNIEEDIKEINNEINRRIDRVNSFEELKKLVEDKILVNEINQKISDYQQKLTKDKINIYDIVCNEIIMQIKNDGNVEFKNKKNMKDFEISKINENVSNKLKDIEVEIEEKKRELEELKEEVNLKQKSNRNDENDIKKMNQEEVKLKGEIDSKESYKRFEINSLGEKPKTEEKIRLEQRKGILKIFGYKKVSYQDDTMQKEWEEEKKRIETKFNYELEDIKNKINLLEKERSKLEEKLYYDEAYVENNKRIIKNIEEDLKILNNKREVEEKKSQKAAFREYSDNLKEQIKNYLQGNTTKSILEQLINNSKKDFENLKERTLDEVLNFYDEVIKNEIKIWERKNNEIVEDEEKRINEKEIEELNAYIIELK